ncbi:MAG: DUF3990 domain-containing protein [Clostridiales bacterium]|jgi:hypothetical protein|nr:DUF3990 domain-containing protein [Clostridiales bacterium]
MKVYHGSDTYIEKVDLSKCQPGKDFGHGFYVTKYRHQAEGMAIRVSKWSKVKPAVTEFDFKELAYEDHELNVLRFDDYTEDWFDFVMLNRNNETRVQVHAFDIVEGPVADDKVTRRIFTYFEGELSKEKFLEELKYHEPTHQICFCTSGSLQMLKSSIKKSEYEIVDMDEAIPTALVVDYGMTVDKAIDLYFSSSTYKSLTDEASGLYLNPWTEIYQLLLQELRLKGLL